jgi:cell division protein FtsL
MTRRRASSKVTARRTSYAVAKTVSQDRVASVRMTVKMVLWAAFFSALFTLHAHLGLKTAALRAETRRLQRTEQEMTNERRQLLTELTMAEDGNRVQQIALTQLHMVPENRSEQLVVPQGLVNEVHQAAADWTNPGANLPAGGGVRAWLENLAGLWPGQDHRG